MSLPLRDPGTDPVPDDTLVQAFRGDPDGRTGREAAARLLERYQDRVYLWCFRLVRDHERAKDLTQDALLSAWKALPQFEGRAPFGAWLFTIARNRCYRALRPVSMTRDEDADTDLLPAGDPPPDERFEREQEEGRMLELVRRTLEPIEQRALWMRCVEHAPVQEITRALQLGNASGARALLQKARRKLRAAVEAEAAREGTT